MSFVEGLLDSGVDHLGAAEDAVGLFRFVVDAGVLVAATANMPVAAFRRRTSAFGAARRIFRG
jgi:hypothetical protein